MHPGSAGVELQVSRLLTTTMKDISSVLAALALVLPAVSAQKYVFAQVVVANTAAHPEATWTNDITLA